MRGDEASGGEQTVFRKEALEQFTRRGEKTLPPVFVGRGDILQDILDIAHES